MLQCCQASRLILLVNPSGTSLRHTNHIERKPFLWIPNTRQTNKWIRYRQLARPHISWTQYILSLHLQPQHCPHYPNLSYLLEKLSVCKTVVMYPLMFCDALSYTNVLRCRAITLGHFIAEIVSKFVQHTSPCSGYNHVPIFNYLTYCGLVKPYGDIDVGEDTIQEQQDSSKSCFDWCLDTKYTAMVMVNDKLALQSLELINIPIQILHLLWECIHRLLNFDFSQILLGLGSKCESIF